MSKCNHSSQVYLEEVIENKNKRISELEAECQLNRNCKLAVAIAKERIAELEAEIKAVQEECHVRQRRYDKMKAERDSLREAARRWWRLQGGCPSHLHQR